MQLSSAEMVQMVFKHVVPCDLSKYNCTSDMLTLLVHIDGVSNLSTVSKKAGVPITEAVDAVTRLSELRIIEFADQANAFLSADLIKDLHTHYSAAVGPIAGVLIEDAMRDLGHTKNTFPKAQAAKLVEVLAKDIQRQDKHTAFKKEMMARIKKG